MNDIKIKLLDIVRKIPSLSTRDPGFIVYSLLCYMDYHDSTINIDLNDIRWWIYKNCDCKELKAIESMLKNSKLSHYKQYVEEKKKITTYFKGLDNNPYVKNPLPDSLIKKKFKRIEDILLKNKKIIKEIIKKMVYLEYIKVDSDTINWQKINLEDIFNEGDNQPVDIKDKYVILSLIDTRYIHKTGEVDAIKKYKIQSFLNNLTSIPITYNYRF